MAESETQRIELISGIDDIRTMNQVMEALDISSKGCQTLQDMKDRVITTTNQSSKSISWSAGQAFSVLLDAKDDDVRKRAGLLSLYAEVEELLNKLDPQIVAPLQQSVPDFAQKLKNHKLQLTQKEYFVLVAGETGSGKSSLINLILGEELLPYSVLSTTSTICELRFGEERKIVAHYKDKDPETGLPTKVVPLRECQGRESTEQGYLQQISPYVHVKSDRERGSIFKKIELFWPHSLLEKGIVIVDSPGVGESDIMDEIVTQYLPQAFAFLYVINSANAGGVQRDRLERLLEKVRKVTLERQGALPTKSALFVCNKWDQVPEKERNEVKNHVIKKLQRCWPGVDPESQIIHMSTTNASQAQDYKIVTEEFSTLMNSLRRMVLKSIGDMLEIHWNWLDNLLSRTIYQAKALVMNAYRDRDKVILRTKEIARRIKEIEKEQSKVIADLNVYRKERVNGALRELSEYLSSEVVKAPFTSWTKDEVPALENSWEVTENQIAKVLSKRLRDLIEQWEEDKQVFAGARASIEQHFQKRYNFMEGQLRDLQNAITVDITDVSGDQLQLSQANFSLAKKVVIGVTSPIWVPLGLAALVIGVPIYGIVAMRSKLEDRKKMRNYEEDKCAFMREASAVYLENVIDDKWLKPFVKEQMKEAKIFLKQIEARLPELIEADKLLCKQLCDETRSQREITELYRPIMDEGSHLRGRLAEFGFKEVRATDISADNLEWKEDVPSPVGCGASGVMYQAKMKRNKAYITVALKLYQSVLDAQNASHFMAEVQILRKLRHPHIVKFYGTSLLWEENSVRIILVLEWCKDDLRSHISKKKDLIPGKSRSDDAIRNVYQWVNEIIDALAYIHEQGIVHRDLKLDNILLSEENSVKVTDVGISKAAVDITGTLAGSPAYIAPEVIKSQVYNSKADIYSLGILLWEIWYGEQAFAGTELALDAFFKMVDDGGRPKPLEGCLKPDSRWKELMEKCWNKDPEKRPSAKECLKSISAIFKNE